MNSCTNDEKGDENLDNKDLDFDLEDDDYFETFKNNFRILPLRRPAFVTI